MITETKSPADQFAEDFLLVADNDYDFYNELVEDSKQLDIVELSDKLREEYELLAEKVGELTELHVSPVAADLIRQLLCGWGSSPFDAIAKELKSRQ